MKKLYLLLSLLFLSTTINAQNPDAFIMTFEAGFSLSNQTIVVPIVQNSANNYTVDFGDGTILTNQTGNVSHIYDTAGIYTVSLTGTFGHINFSTLSNTLKLRLKSVEQWGTNQWTSMQSAFESCSNLIINATDVPDLSQVTDMSNMFKNATSFNQPVNNWDVSNVTNMSYMFRNAILFNQPLDNWDVSNVTDMSYMFEYTDSFNQPLNNWDVSNVINMRGMFSYAYSFNQPLDNWNVSNVTDMAVMFAEVSSFNQDLSNWDVSNVTNMGSMFSDASSFNQDLSNWDVSSVTDMVSMFRGAALFNQPLNNWDVSSVTNMAGMFRDATSFNQPLDNWNVSNVTIMSNMFYGTSSFNQSLSSWNFKTNVSFSTINNTSNGFLNYSGLDTINYDFLLLRFAELELQNKTLAVYGIKYCNSSVRSHLINNLGWTIVGDSLADDCNYNIVYGNVLFDENNNGCDSDDAKTDMFLVNADNGTPYYTALSNNGGYQLNLFEDTYTISLLNLPDYLTATPVSSTFAFTDFGSYEELNFCLTTNQTIQDLNIVILPITQARPGFETDYQLVVQNIGTQTMDNVLITLTFDDTMQSFVSANPTESSATTNQLNFEIASLSPFSSSVIDFTMQTFTPPTVNGDDILNFTATVTPNTDDYTPNDNTFELAQIVVNSYDPNDKLVLQGSEIYIDNVNEYLHYIVRFQNTGTASAINVRIEDELHESLDWNTIQILNSSHNYRVEIKDGNQMEFIFNNINLPYEDEDEEGSNGFIAYKIKPIAGTQLGDFIIGNEAYIYFDYNEPIITNTTSTEVVEETSSVSAHSLNDLISVYPNPTNGVLHISSKGNTILEEVKIYNLQGRELFNSVQNLETIRIEDLSSGVYLMNIKTNQGTISKRVIKK